MSSINKETRGPIPVFLDLLVGIFPELSSPYKPWFSDLVKSLLIYARWPALLEDYAPA